MEKDASKESWKNYPIREPKLVVIKNIDPKLKLHFSIEQYNNLKKGLIPKEMEDKWFIYFEDNWLYFHRSWTGYGQYKAEIIEIRENDVLIYAIQEFYVERDKEYYTNDDDCHDFDIFLQLLFWGLLKIDVREIYFKKYGNDNSQIMSVWSNFGRMHFNVDNKDE